MFESIAGKVLAGIVSLSALMFTSYTGNDPVFLPLHSRVGPNYLMLKATLDNAFDNDFSDVFKCGKPIHLWFKVEIKHHNRSVFTHNYRHSVSYDPMNASWKLFRSETNQTEVFTNYKALITSISELECSIPLRERWKIVDVSIEANLPEIEMTQSNRTVDLMVLWKFQVPRIRANLNLETPTKGK